MFATLLAITSRLSCCAFIPVAAMAKAFMAGSLDLHACDFEISGHQLVTDGGGGLQ
jgi:hypothetical protein